MKKLLIVLLLILSGCHAPERSVIKLTSLDKYQGATGFEVYTPSGKIYTLTNRHVCEMLDTVYAEVGDRSIPLRVVEKATSVDLCLMEGIVNIPALSLSLIKPVSQDPVDVYGFGKLYPLQKTSGLFVGDLPEPLFGVLVPQLITATVLPGNSGSPVLNSEGDVIGVVFATGDMVGYRGIIISLADIQHFLQPY